jgi:cardiolipin synthase A/B
MGRIDLLAAVFASAALLGSAQAQSVITVNPDPNHPLLSRTFQDSIDQLTGSPLTAGNTFELLEDGVRAFPRKLDLVRSARDTIFFTTMEAALDTTGTVFVDELIAAARRGVDVRCVIGSRYTSSRVFRRLERGGVKTVRYNPIYDIGGRKGRLHVKMVVADLRRAIVGGMNMKDSYNLGDGLNDDYHDVDALVEGDVAAEASREFLKLWLEFNGGDAAAQTMFTQASLWSRLIPAGPSRIGSARFIWQASDRGEFYIRDAYRAQFDQARNQILWYTNNLNIPNGPLLRSMKDATARGVRVALITNSLRASIRRVGFVGWFQYYYLRILRWLRLRNTAIEVWESDVPIHSKVMTIDGVMASIGSYNFSTTSQKNMELTVEVHDPTLVSEVEQMIERDLQQATRAR